MTSTAPVPAADLQARRVAIPAIAAPPAVTLGRVHRFGGDTMGTSWCVSVVSPLADPVPGLQALVQTVLDDVVVQMSTWRADSWISRFNDAPAGTAVVMPAETATVLACAIEVASLTEGAYDPTMGPLTDLWGFGPPGPRTTPPDTNEVRRCHGRTGWQRLVCDAPTRTLVQPGGIRLDLSAIAKGFAVDAVSDRLARAGVDASLVDIGGELRGRGVKPDGQPWWVELESPRTQAHAAGDDTILLALHDVAVATSGDYRRFFEHDGRRYAHTIDPRTGRPVGHALASATIVHASCMTADALSTALTVMGVEEGLAFCATHDIAACLVDRDGDTLREHRSDAFDTLLS